jgi:diguanylate cyclase (GGDEF)-like protein/PAS domain S-box-containing protein
MIKNSILIVDDERANISALKTILSPEYTIYASSDGQEAIETAEEFLPGVILLDVLMPDMDGYDVIGELKRSEKTRDIPVIFITGLDSPGAEEKGLAMGAADYISKPFTSAVVKLRVHNQLKIANHAKALDEQLRQQALMTKISHSFLSDIYVDSLFADTLCMVGEFMDISAVLLYKLEDDERTLVCRSEWRKPELNLETHIGSKFELSEPSISILNSMLAIRKGNLCLNSGDPAAGSLISPLGDQPGNYITTPVFIKGKICAALVFSRENNDEEWDANEINLAVLVSSIFSGVFERDAMERQFSIVENSPNLILYIKANAGVEYVNPAVLDVTGYTKAELAAQGLGAFFGEAVLGDMITRHIPDALGGKPVLFETEITRKDGKKRILMVSVVKTGDAGLGIITSDLTHIRELESEAEKIYYDPLTDIYNRRFFDEAIIRLMPTLARAGSMLSLMMIDIDFFKKYNDTYGHNEGDECLKIVAAALAGSLPRSDDFVARYGGEEFVAVLPNTDANGACMLADKLLESIRNSRIPHKASDISDYITVSIGVTTGKASHIQSGDDYVKRADEMLYKSKNSGRNKYTFKSL